jgi:serine/threonine protein phosphatase 1
MRQFAITDIHGCAQTFEALLDRIALTHLDELYLLGDYVDRGPDSKGVVEAILGMKQDGYKVHCLMGNHEIMLLDLAAQSPDIPLNLHPGLVETLVSYGCRHPKDIPTEHLDFFSSLKYYLEVDNYILVHAGLNFSATNPLEDYDAMLWDRNWYAKINKKWLNGRVILHGHTPTKLENILRMYASLEDVRALALDNGCVFHANGLHQLTAYDMTNKRLFFQNNIDG